MSHYTASTSVSDGRRLRDVLVDAERRLAAAGVDSPRADAEQLLAYVLGVSRSRMIMSDTVERPALVRLEGLLVKRQSRIPLQHILGETGFRHLVLGVGRGVFVPRPETEIVAEAAIRALKKSSTRLAVDLCTGSGAIALALATEVHGSVVHAVEVDHGAHHWAARNITAHADELAGAGSTVVLHLGDATKVHEQLLAHIGGMVDVVVANPPYIPDDAVPRDIEVRDYDPDRALYGGPDGLDIVRGVAVSAAELLRPHGVLVIEHGDQQGENAGMLGVPGTIRAHGCYDQVVDLPDLSGRDRCTVAVRRELLDSH